MSDMQPTKAFLEHSLGFAGINGGNPHSPLWFCGIEFGSKPDVVELDAPASRFDDNSDFPSYTEATVRRVGGWGVVCKWPYLQKMARISLAYQGHTNTGIRDVRKHIRGGLLGAPPDGVACHLNLYPLPMNRAGDDGYGREHQALTGFPTKVLYKAWCMEHRFPFLRKLVEQYRPEVVVCTGSSFAQDFRFAFLGVDRIHPEAGATGNSEKLVRSGDDDPQAGEKVRAPKVVEFTPINEHTLLVVTPFLGQGGLMANEDLENLGRILRDRARAHRA